MGRSKGRPSSTSSSSSIKLEVGTPVFAKVRGYPYWPARIEEAIKGDKYKVFFFGTYETATVKKNDVVVFDEKSKAKYGNQMKRKSFPEGMKEMEENPGILTKEQIDEELLNDNEEDENVDEPTELDDDQHKEKEGEDVEMANEDVTMKDEEDVDDKSSEKALVGDDQSTEEAMEQSMEKSPEEKKTDEPEEDSKVTSSCDDTLKSKKEPSKENEVASEMIKGDFELSAEPVTDDAKEAAPEIEPSNEPSKDDLDSQKDISPPSGSSDESTEKKDNVALPLDEKMKESEDYQAGSKDEKEGESKVLDSAIEDKVESSPHPPPEKANATSTANEGEKSVAESSSNAGSEVVEEKKLGRTQGSSRKRGKAVGKGDMGEEDETTPRSKRVIPTPSPSVTTSRSGRVIKPKKFNDDMPERRSRRQSSESERRSSGRLSKLSTGATPVVDSGAVTKESRKLWVQVKATGEAIEINMDANRPAMFESGEEELRWERATARNALKFKEKVESGQFIPEEIKLRIEAKQKRSPEEEAVLEKEKQNAKRIQKLNTLKTELRLAELDLEVKRSLPLDQPDMDLCLKLLSELESMSVTNLMLKKQPQVVATMRNLRKYVGPSNTESAEDVEEKEESVSELANVINNNTANAQKICLKADQIVSRWISNFALGEGQIFWEVFDSEVVKFREATEKLEPEKLVTLTTDPANNGLNSATSASSE